ncbi:MAG: hypothetical protein HYT87_00010 [Nitrospirae bacterium]|nr:hypothetical protein [Nitrospirota bacterium]
MAVVFLDPSPRAEAQTVSIDALWNVVSESLDWGGACGIKPDFNATEFSAAVGVISSGPAGAVASSAFSTAFGGDPNPCFGIYLKYNVPYYLVEVVPERWDSVLAPDVFKDFVQPLTSVVEEAIQPFFKPLGINFKGRGGSFGGMNYYEVHVYRLAFDVGAMVSGVMKEIVKSLATHGIGMNIGLDPNWLSPDICYLSEFDPFRWKLGLPTPEYQLTKAHRCWVEKPGKGKQEYPCEWKEDVKAAMAKAGGKSGGLLGKAGRGVGKGLGAVGLDKAGDVVGGAIEDVGELAEGVGEAVGSAVGNVAEVVGEGVGAIGEEDYELPPVLIQRRAEDRMRFWEGTNQAGLFSWANINDRSGWVTHADPKFAAAALALRGASLATKRPTSDPKKFGGCWIDGRGADEFDPLSPAALSKKYDEPGGVSIQLIHTKAGGGTWNSCVPIGWESQQWNRPEYWTGNVTEGALYVIYERRKMCLVDLKTYLENVAALTARLLQDAAFATITAGMGVPAIAMDYILTISATIAQVQQMYEDVKRVLDYIQKIQQAIQWMKDIMEMFKILFEQLGSEMMKQGGGVAINAVTQLAMTVFEVDADIQKGFNDVQCSMDIGRRALEGTKALTGLSVCGHGTGDIPGMKSVNAKISSIEGKIPPILLKPPISTMADTACRMGPLHDPVQSISSTLRTYETKLKTIERYLTYGDYACMAVRTISNPPRDAEGLIRMFGDLKIGGDTAALFTVINALDNLRHPDAMLTASVAEVRALPGFPQSEIAWWEGKANSVQSNLTAANFTASRAREIPNRLKHLIGPELVKDLAAPIEQDAKNLISGGLGLSTKMFEDFDALAKGGERLMRKISAVADVKMDKPERAVEAILAFASLKVEFERWMGDMQRLMQNMPAYQKELQKTAANLQKLIGTLPNKIRNLDRTLADQVYAAVFIDTAPLRHASGDLRDMANRAASLPGRGPQLAAGFKTAADGLDAVANGMSVLSKQKLYDLMDPVHKVLAQAGDALDSLTQGVGSAGTGMLAEMENLTSGLGNSELLSRLGSFSTDGAGPAFRGPVAKDSGLWDFLGTIESYARMKEGAVVKTAWNEAVSESAGEPREKRGAAAMGRFVRKTVPLRQEEKDAAGGDDNVAKDALEKKATDEHRTVIETARDPKKYGLLEIEDYRKERAESGSPVNKAWQDAVNACKEKAREKKQKAPREGWDESMCDRRW